MVLEAGYPNTIGFRKVVKATILVKKKPGMSDEDFIQHYNHKHAQMVRIILPHTFDESDDLLTLLTPVLGGTSA